MALPVGQGDAFYLETPQGSVLVDGGRSRSAFSTLFREFANRDGADVVIVTHNDADHANGIIGFLEAGLRCREIWLPGRWLQVLPHSLRPVEEILVMILRQVKKAAAAITSGEARKEDTLLERYAAFLGSAERPTEIPRGAAEVGHLDESGWPFELLAELERAAVEDEWWIFEYPWHSYIVTLIHLADTWPFLSESAARLLVEALCAVERIRTIALEAFRRGIAVRWFEHDPDHPSGGTSYLQPISCRQMVRMVPAREDALVACLALSVANRESLVFLNPPTETAPGVLFTADSDLQGVRLPPLEHVIVTAPHHGSEANRGAYTRVARVAMQSITWVRSDGRFRSRPGQAYLNRQERKVCTLCRGTPVPKQSVVFYARGARWVRGKGVRTCGCR